MSDYRQEAKSDAADFVLNFEDEVIEQLIDKGEASDDFLNDYPGGDSYHHDTHVDKWYDLSDAAEVLDSLSEYEETDRGLWEGLEPREAIGAQAAYTYGNAVYSMATELIEEINDKAEEIIEEFDDEATEKEEDRDDDELKKHLAVMIHEICKA